MEFTGTTRYELICKLGEGGMGIVYEAHDRTRNMRVALKTLRNLNADNLYRFKREFRALSNLSHPNIIHLYELVAEGDFLFLTMEIVEGEDFISFIRGGRQARRDEPRSAPRPGEHTETAETRTSVPVHNDTRYTSSYFGTAGLPVPPMVPSDLDDLVDIRRLRSALGQLADALHTLHLANMVHRDLKPSNVQVTAEGRLVLMDFSIVADISSKGDSADLFAAGTPQYMAPEQVCGAQPTAATDWYAFGVLMYLALTGRLPYEGGRMQILRTKQERDPLAPRYFTTGIPEALETLCMELLSRDPGKRPVGDEVLRRLGIVASETTTSGEFPVLSAAEGLFVGRVHELRLLRRAYAQVRQGRTLCVFVQGPSGIGKSSLSQRFLYELGALGTRRPLVFSGRCQARESLTYKAFDGVIDDLSQYLANLAKDKRSAAMYRWAGSIARLFPTLRWISDNELPAALVEPNPLRQRAEAVAALRELLSDIAAQHPVIIYTEDMQWADRDSVELLIDLLQPPAPAGLLVLATLRTDETDRAESQSLFFHMMERLSADVELQPIHLGPLSEAEQRELMAKMATIPEYQGVNQFLGDALWRESAGNPMLLAELARSTQEAPAELAEGGGLHLEDVIWGRFKRLDRNAQALMRCIAIAGDPLPLHILARASSLSSIECERALGVLHVGHLARIWRTDPEPWLVVYHGKVREAIIERLEDTTVVQLHRRIAEVLETWSEASIAALAEHWRAAGDQVKAATYCCHLAASAAQALAFERAAELYRLALSLMPEHGGSRELEIMRCQAWICLAEELTITGRDSATALQLLDRAEAKAGEYDLADELIKIHHLRSRVLLARGSVHAYLSEHKRASQYLHEGSSAAQQMLVLSGLGVGYYINGEIAAAHEHLSRSIALGRERENSQLEARCLALRGLTHFWMGDMASALRDSMSAASISVGIGDMHTEVYARVIGVPWALFEMGHIHQARSELEEGLRIARDPTVQSFECVALAYLGRIMAYKGRVSRALQLIEESLHKTKGWGDIFMRPMALATLARVAGEPRARQRALAEAEELLQSGAVSHNYFYFYRDAMDVAFAAGDADAVEHYGRALADYTRNEPTVWSRLLVAKSEALAAHLRGHGDPVAIRDLVSEARKAGLHTEASILERAMAAETRTR